MVEVTVWVKVDADGNYEVATEPDACAERWAESYTDDGTPARMVRIVLAIPAPKPVTVRATLADMANEGTAVVE